MQTHATPQPTHVSKPPPFFSVQAQREPAFFSQSPFPIAAQADMETAEPEEAQIQTKMSMGAPGDAYEREADAMADRVVQRKFAGTPSIGETPAVQAKCTACHEEEGKVRRQAEGEDKPEPDLQAKSDGSLEVPGNVQKTLEGGTGGGAAMHAPVREEMESAFGTDFSDVRIHTGSNAEGLNKDLNSHAFTYGKDVYFNSGEYRPETPQGQHLLAHELTHVVQQNPGLQTKARAPAASSSLSSASTPQVQAALWSFGPPGGKFYPGTDIHNEVLPRFVKANKDLFIEVAIPGATKKDVDTGRAGIADFYKAKPNPLDKDGKSRTIGINLGKGGPTFLDKNTRFAAGTKYSHATHAAPRGGETTPRVRGTKQAPNSISLGDLKPGNSAESYLGHAQLSNYKQGIDNTARDVDAWLGKPENAGQNQDNAKWSPSVSDLGQNALQIPPELDFTKGGKGLYKFDVAQLAVYKDGKMEDKMSGLHGAMFVYPHHVSGIWAYEWFPYSIPTTTASGNVEKTVKRLDEEVIKPVKATGVSSPPLRRSVRRKGKPKLRRKFDFAGWQRGYGNWKTDAEKSMAAPDEKKKANVAETLLDVDKRTGNKIKLPQAVKDRGLAYRRIRHWMKFGRIYGWLRNTFDGIYVKVKNFTDKIKAKVNRLLRRSAGAGFADWKKAAIKVVFKIFKIVAGWTITKVLDHLMSSLQQGITNNINKLIDAVTPEDVKSKIEEFEEKKAEYEALIKETEKNIEEKLFGDKLKLLESVAEWEHYANQVSTIITVLEWGVRILACASPPAVGCLWNLAISALQAAFAILLQSCWFTKKVYAPVLEAIPDVREFPKTIAAKVAAGANSLIPLPKGADPLFAEIKLENSEIPVDCDEAGGGGGGRELTPEQQAILDLAEEIGTDKMNALLELMNKRGAGPWVLLTAERLRELKGFIDEVTPEQLKAAAAAPTSEVSVPIEKFLAGIAKYTKSEKQLIVKSNELKKAKSEAGEGKGGGAGKSAPGAGGGGEGSKFDAPIYKQPTSKEQDTAAVEFSAMTELTEELKTGGSYPKEIEIFVVVGVMAKDSKGVAKVYPVRVKVKSVTDQKAVFVNVKAFYAYYFGTQWVEIPKNYEINVPRTRLINVKE